MQTISIPLANGSAAAHVTGWVEANGTTHTGLPTGYSYPVFTANDSGGLVTLSPLGPDCTVNFKGVAGTFILTATSSKSGSPDLLWQVEVVLSGPVPTGLTGTIS